MSGELFRWVAWGAVAREGGGVHPAGSEYIATETDPRVLADRSRRLGPAVPQPVVDAVVPDAVAAAFEADQ